jgi:hypothetical protein
MKTANQFEVTNAVRRACAKVDTNTATNACCKVVDAYLDICDQTERGVFAGQWDYWFDRAKSFAHRALGVTDQDIENSPNPCHMVVVEDGGKLYCGMDVN